LSDCLLAAIDDLKNSFQSNNSILIADIAKLIPPPIPTPPAPDNSELIQAVDSIKTTFQENSETNHKALLTAIQASTEATQSLHQALLPSSSDSSTSLHPHLSSITTQLDNLNDQFVRKSKSDSKSMEDFKEELQSFLRTTLLHPPPTLSSSASDDDDISPYTHVTLFLYSTPSNQLLTINSSHTSSPTWDLPSFLTTETSKRRLIQECHDFAKEHLNYLLPKHYDIFFSNNYTHHKQFFTTTAHSPNEAGTYPCRGISFAVSSSPYADNDSPTFETSCLQTFSPSELVHMQSANPTHMLNPTFTLLQQYMDTSTHLAELTDEGTSSKPSATTHAKTSSPKKETPDILNSTTRPKFIATLIRCSNIASLHEIAPLLNKQHILIDHPWPHKQLSTADTTDIIQYIQHVHNYAQEHLRTPPWSSITTTMKQAIINHPTNKNRSSSFLTIANILHPASLPTLLAVLCDMAKPTNHTLFYAAYNRTVHFANPTVHEHQTALTVLASCLDVFLANTFTFYHYFNKEGLKIPFTTKKEGFLFHIYRKMPHMLVLLTQFHNPISRDIITIKIEDFIHHINRVVTDKIKTPNNQSADLQAVLPDRQLQPEPLLDRYPLYTGSTDLIPSKHSATKRYEPNPTLPTPQPRLHDTNRHTTPYQQRPYHSNNPNPHHTNQPHRQQHLHHLDYNFDHTHFDEYDDSPYLYQHECEDNTLPATQYTADDEHFEPEDVTYPPLQTMHSVSELQRIDLQNEYAFHLLRTAPEQTQPPTAACYKLLWTGHCPLQFDSHKPCKWEHDRHALRQAWIYHDNLLRDSPYRDPHHTAQPTQFPRRILPRSQPYRHHQDRHPLPRNHYRGDPPYPYPPRQPSHDR